MTGTTCHRCGGHIEQFHGHDRPIQLRHLPAFGREVKIEIRPKRYRCPHCEGRPTSTQRCEWYEPNRPHTRAYEKWALGLLIHSTVADVSRLTDLGVKAIKGIFHHHVDANTAGTRLFLQLEAKEIRDITPIDHRFAFVARRDQLELWLSDGTAEGSRVILATDPDEGLIDDLLVTGTHLLFGANKIVQESADDFPDWPAHIPRIENHGHELYGFPLIPAPRGASTGGDVLLADGFE